MRSIRNAGSFIQRQRNSFVRELQYECEPVALRNLREKYREHFVSAWRSLFNSIDTQLLCPVKMRSTTYLKNDVDYGAKK